MCNIAAALGVGLLLMMGGRGGSKKDAYTPPVAPTPSTNYGSTADNLANTNQGLASDAQGSPAASSTVSEAKASSAGGMGYRNQLAIPKAPQPSGPALPTIGSVNRQKPVNY